MSKNRIIIAIAALFVIVLGIQAYTPCVRIVVASNFKKKIKFEIRNEKI